MGVYSRIVAVVILVFLAGGQVVAQNQGQVPTDPSDTRIPRKSRVYTAPSDGFEQYLAAAFRKKSVPLLIVTDRDAADFEITVTHEKKEASWARILVWGILQPSATASLQVVKLKD